MSLRPPAAAEHGALAQLARFAVVGGLGTVTNLGLLCLRGDSPRSAVRAPRAGCTVGFAAAVTENYVPHELWTFRGRVAGPGGLSLARYAKFVAASLLGFAVNAVVLVGLLAVHDFAYASIPQAIGIASGTLLNFAASRQLVFRRRG